MTEDKKLVEHVNIEIKELYALGDFNDIRDEASKRVGNIDGDAFKYYQQLYDNLPSFRNEVANPKYNQMMADKIILCYQTTMRHYSRAEK